MEVDGITIAEEVGFLIVLMAEEEIGLIFEIYSYRGKIVLSHAGHTAQQVYFVSPSAVTSSFSHIFNRISINTI